MPDDTDTETNGAQGEGMVASPAEAPTPAPEIPAPGPAEAESWPEPEPESQTESQPEPETPAADSADVATSTPPTAFTQPISPTPSTTPPQPPESATNGVYPDMVKNTTSVASVVSVAPIVPTAPSKSWALSLLAKARASMQFKKQKKLDEIMALAAAKGHGGQKGAIVSRDVELLLHVSAATATRYLEALVKGGRLRAVGAFRHTMYEVVG